MSGINTRFDRPRSGRRLARSPLPSEERRQRLIRQHARALWGDTPGWVAAAEGRGGHITDTGSYDFDTWVPRYFQWPDEASPLIRWALRESRLNDLYVCPLLRKARDCRRGTGLASSWVWADVDSQPTSAASTKVRPIPDDGYLAVRSSKGNLQIYLPLDRRVSPDMIEQFNYRLVSCVQADSKWADNSMMRLPGTFNHKGRATGGTSWLVQPRDPDSDPQLVHWTEQELHDFLPEGQPPGRQDTFISGPDPKRYKKVLESLPAPLKALAAERPGADRSDQSFRLAARLFEEGISDIDAGEILRQHPPTVHKCADRNISDYIAHTIANARTRHPHPGETCTEALCHNQYAPPSEVTDALLALHHEMTEANWSFPAAGPRRPSSRRLSKSPYKLAP